MKVIICSLLLTTLCIVGACTNTGPQTGPGAGSFFSDDERVDDSIIESAVQTALKQDTLLAAANIQVDSDQGVVTLSGTVPNATAYLRALRIARDTKGVRPPVKAIELKYPQ